MDANMDDQREQIASAQTITQIQASRDSHWLDLDLNFAMPSRSSTFQRFHLPFAGNHSNGSQTKLADSRQTSRPPSSHQQVQIQPVPQPPPLRKSTMTPTAFGSLQQSQFDADALITSLEQVGRAKYPPSSWPQQSAESSLVRRPRVNSGSNDGGFSGGHAYTMQRAEEKRRLEALGLASDSPTNSTMGVCGSNPTSPTSPNQGPGRPRRTSWVPPANGKLQKERSKSHDARQSIDSIAYEGPPRPSFSRIFNAPPTPPSEPYHMKRKPIPNIKTVSTSDLELPSLPFARPNGSHSSLPTTMANSPSSPSLGDLANYFSTKDYELKTKLMESPISSSSSMVTPPSINVVHNEAPFSSSTSSLPKVSFAESPVERGRSRQPRLCDMNEKDKEVRRTTLGVFDGLPKSHQRATSNILPVTIPDVIPVHQRSTSAGNLLQETTKSSKTMYPKTPPPGKTKMALPPLPPLPALSTLPKYSPSIPRPAEESVSPIKERVAITDFDQMPIVVAQGSVSPPAPPIPPRAPGHKSRDSSLAPNPLSRQERIEAVLNKETLQVPPTMAQMASELQRSDSVADSVYSTSTTPKQSMWLASISGLKARKRPSIKAPEERQLPASSPKKASERKDGRISDINNTARAARRETPSPELPVLAANLFDTPPMNLVLGTGPEHYVPKASKPPVSMTEKKVKPRRLSFFRSESRESKRLSSDLSNNTKRTSTSGPLSADSILSGNSWEATPTQAYPSLLRIDTSVATRPNAPVRRSTIDVSTLMLPPHEQADWIAPPPSTLSLAPRDWSPSLSERRHVTVPALPLHGPASISSQSTRNVSPQHSSAASSQTSLSSFDNVIAPLVVSPPKTSSAAGTSNKKQKQKLFAQCCQCDLLHDLHPELHQKLMEEEEPVECLHCAHRMTTTCCERWATVVRFENRLL